MTKVSSLNLIAQSGASGIVRHNKMDRKQLNPQQNLSNRPSRLEKQEEFEEEEEITYMPSPVTIQIEDRDGGFSDEENESAVGSKDGCETHGVNGSKEYYERGDANKNESGSDTLSPNSCDDVKDKHEKGKVSSRVKLLVRSQAVHDDASPPPDLDTIIANTNMLSVTNAPVFATQTQAKSSKRLGHQGSSQGSQGSTESSSGLSRDSSTETYTDSSGVDLQQFIIDTLHKNQKDRMMLLKIEQELIILMKDTKRHTWKFGQMSSYNRMLVHRVAAYFGFDHYVDASGTSVIVTKTKNTRIPDSRFQDHFRDELLPEEPKKSILKRDSISFEESKEKSPERQSSTDSRRSKSFEEREEEYEKARARIFNKDEGLGESPISHRGSQEDIRWPSSDTKPWSSTDSDSSGRLHGAKGGSSFETEGISHVSNKQELPASTLMKADSNTKEKAHPSNTVRPVMTKASSFGGISVLSRESPSEKQPTPKITKAESFNVTTLSSSCTSLSTSVVSSASSASISATSSASLQTTSPSQLPSAAAQQTFPLVAGQPAHLHLPIQQFSSQIQGWPVGCTESSLGTEYTEHPVPIGQPLIWPVSSAPELMFPGNVALSPPPGVPYVNVDGSLYGYKIPSNTGGQPIMLTPFQPLTLSPQQNQVPISSISPTSQHPPPVPSQSNISLSIPPSQSQQQQQQQTLSQQSSQPAAIQSIPPPSPTVLYVPFMAPQQVQTPVQPPISGSAPNLTLQPPSAQQPPLPQQVTQPILSNAMAYNINQSPSSVDEITAQLQSLGFLTTAMPPAPPPPPPPLPQQQQPSPSQQPQDMTSTTPNLNASAPYILSNLKSQGYISPQGNIPQAPFFYMPHVPAPSSIQPVPYVLPGSSVAQHGFMAGQVNNCGIPRPVMADMQNLPTQGSSSVSGPAYLPGYSVLALPQTGDTSASSTFVSYTLASQTTTITTTTSVLVPSSPMTMPIYPYGNLFLNNINSSTQTSFTTTPTTQSQPHQPSYMQTPIAIQASTSALPLYVLTTTATQTVAASAQVAAMSSPFASFRSQSLPSASSSSSSSGLNPQLQTVGSSATGVAMGYIYSPQQLSCTVTQPSHTTSVTVSALSVSNVLSSQAVSSQLPPTILTTFQVLRPNLSLVGNLRTGTPPPAQQTLLSQFSSSTNKVPPLSFPLVKQASDPGVDCFGLGSGGRTDPHKGGCGAQFQPTSFVAPYGNANLVNRRGTPLVQGDLCFIGPPLQHQFNPLAFPGQRPVRFIHSAGLGISPTRLPKNRSKQRILKNGQASNSGSRSGTVTTGSSDQTSQDISASHILEIEGLPEGMKRSEIERYLEQVTSHGAKIKYLNTESGTSVKTDSDFIVSARYLVIAVFESDTGAQSALLGIKTPKFQLRPLRRSISDVAQLKHS